MSDDTEDNIEKELMDEEERCLLCGGRLDHWGQCAADPCPASNPERKWGYCDTCGNAPCNCDPTKPIPAHVEISREDLEAVYTYRCGNPRCPACGVGAHEPKEGSRG